MVIATHKTFEMCKENNCMSKCLAIMEKKTFESEVAHKKLDEGFDSLKIAHQKANTELARLKACLAEERRVAEERELELLTAQNAVRVEIMRLRLENGELEKSFERQTRSWT